MPTYGPSSLLVGKPAVAQEVRRHAAHHTNLTHDRLADAIWRARRCLLGLQKPDGHWCAELEGDTILESEYILLMAFLGREREERVRKAARYILEQARPEGAWSNYPGGPVDVSVSVKAYFALKIAGHAPNAPYMMRSRELILQHGGAERCNSFTKFYLAFLGQLPYDSCATVPPELVLLPTWFCVNLYAMSSWTRTIVVPLSIFSAYKPVRTLPDHLGIAELFRRDPFQPRLPHPPSKRWFTAHNFFLAIDQLLKLYEKFGPRFLRRKALQRASRWMRAHFADSDGVGAIFPPIIYTIISLRCLGYADDSAEMLYALKQLDDLMIEEKDTLRVQPCFSPVWDTALAVNALAVCPPPRTNQAAPAGHGVHGPHGDHAAKTGKHHASHAAAADEPLAQAARWLLEREVRRPGDWSVLNPGVEPGGWFFEYRNGFYPDTDDTAMVLMGLARSGHAWRRDLRPSRELYDHWLNGSAFSPVLQPRRGHKKMTLEDAIPAAQRAVRWLLAMQNQDGGWAAFDRDINREFLTKVPFADHNAMLDPSCPDITARVLEALGEFGFRADHPQVQRGLRFIEKTQDRRGCWIGRWGVNYLYGTWQVLAGLDAVGFDQGHPLVRRAVRWLEQVQQPCGGWGESCRSYDDPATAGQGPVTASQTGWALLGLIHAGATHSPAVRRGIQYLLNTQQPDGNWHEDQFTGTGFPKVFYLKYHNYRLYFPLMALARYAQAVGGAGVSEQREVRQGELRQMNHRGTEDTEKRSLVRQE